MEGTNYYDCGGSLWIFALLILFGMGGNGFGANGRAATVEDINNSQNFTRLESQVRANADLTERKVDGIANGLSSLGYEMAQQFGRTNTDVAKGFCGVDKEILQAKTEILGALAQNKIDSLTAQVNELKTQNMFCGIPRINPYGYGVYPYSNGCGCNGNF